MVYNDSTSSVPEDTAHDPNTFCTTPQPAIWVHPPHHVVSSQMRFPPPCLVVIEVLLRPPWALTLPWHLDLDAAPFAPHRIIFCHVTRPLIAFPWLDLQQHSFVMNPAHLVPSQYPLAGVLRLRGHYTSFLLWKAHQRFLCCPHEPWWDRHSFCRGTRKLSISALLMLRCTSRSLHKVPHIPRIGLILSS